MFYGYKCTFYIEVCIMLVLQYKNQFVIITTIIIIASEITDIHLFRNVLVSL